MVPIGCRDVSIPQAVGAVATLIEDYRIEELSESFNTASGRCCCNAVIISFILSDTAPVSIPQAVGAVATAGSRKPVFMRFQKLVLENLKP